MTRPNRWRDEADDFNDLLVRMKRVEMATLGNHPTSIEAALPEYPQGGQDFYWSFPGGGQWHFRFNDRTGLCDFVGGPPMMDEVATNQSTSSASYTALSTAGPSLVVPFTGNYIVEIGCRAFLSTNAASTYMSYDIGATGAVDDDSVQQTAGTASAAFNAIRVRPKSFTAADALVAKYKSSGSVSAVFADRFMRLTPVAIGS